MRQQRYTYTQIGEKFNISKQRVHQIMKNYKTLSASKDERLLRTNLLKHGCSLCPNKSINIHHIDKNSNNNSENNLLPLCRKCHYGIHTQKNRCVDCNKIISRKASGAIRCRPCSSIKNKLHTWTKKHKYCIKCKRNDLKHGAKGLCINCYHMSNSCIDCGKQVTYTSTRCGSCAAKNINQLRRKR